MPVFSGPKYSPDKSDNPATFQSLLRQDMHALPNILQEKKWAGVLTLPDKAP